ncbi:polyprenyl synthetase family protein [Myxococcus sp. MISCRS1]|uniref:polyprenyl synthetase family protein n=1 Tax=unclassified Myxococcus TaxID=2648731 RepID=UPI001142F096|nr:MULTISPECIES: polyprenyl synthetase family protein [unclassified Myxococcus]MBZ4397948.1 polyprenyl synthetase family protein [Myxococcus sp. AS-1-15]MBZ4407495.1 polyprenyl synthetase family protein [Myxococcus sp. XM-1-1-1]MCY0998681.1 polyprenyl synthetase family protein [Myxococcus sp. MISCRS1]BDT31325.1 polyprenyl synthetase family protein [Myxococcus sp. MH1]
MALPRPAVQPMSGELPLEQAWLKLVQAQVETSLGELFDLPDEARLDARWTWAMAQARTYALRPAKRVRPALVMAGHCLAKGTPVVPGELWRFAAGLELLHTFLLIHDDVADRAHLRRGGAALHHLLAPGRGGEDLAVVVGDHLFARSLEAMLESGLPGVARVVRYYLSVCRHTAAGQYLDLALGGAPLSQVSLFQTLRVAYLKTARYGFCAPLVCGAMLGGASPELVAGLERVGRQVGLAYQLKDDLIGLFGDSSVAGKAADGDFMQGKRTFPVLAAYVRAPPRAREELELLWSLPESLKDARALARARTLVEEYGGREACERLVTRGSHAARRALHSLPNPNGARDLLDALIARLAHRIA